MAESCQAPQSHQGGHRMNLHANAALCLKGRRGFCLAVVERERTLAQAAEPTPDQRQSRTLHPHPPLRLGHGAIYRCAPRAPPHLTAGSITTTVTANTQPSATNRPSLASTSETNLDGTYTYAAGSSGVGLRAPLPASSVLVTLSLAR